jgi:FKBP-type peptidyl-prolyl cis-trans isomerase
MKKTALALCAFLACMEAGAAGIRDDADMAGDEARTSYAFGMTVGFDLREAGMSVDYAAFAEGLMDAMEGDDGALMIGREEAMELVHIAFERAMAIRAQEARIFEELFLAGNAAEPGVFVTDSGLQYEVLGEGGGPRPEAGDTVLVHYVGELVDGTVFDSSVERGSPEAFPLDMVIPGWSEGLQLMSVGSVYRLFVPSRLAFGAQGAGNIPPFATLIFTVELLAVLDEEDDWGWDFW